LSSTGDPICSGIRLFSPTRHTVSRHCPSALSTKEIEAGNSFACGHKIFRPQAFGERAITLAEPQNNKQTKQNNKSRVLSEFNRPFPRQTTKKTKTKQNPMLRPPLFATGSTAMTTAATLPASLSSTTEKQKQQTKLT